MCKTIEGRSSLRWDDGCSVIEVEIREKEVVAPELGGLAGEEGVISGEGCPGHKLLFLSFVPFQSIIVARHLPLVPFSSGF